jgi:tetratricopeptide (TPR) repeat protein
MSSMSQIKSIIKEQSKETFDSFTDASTMDKHASNQLQTTQSKAMESFIMVWLESNNNNSTEDRDELVMQLRHIISTIQIFTEINECVDFLTDVTDEKVFMIIYDYPDRSFLPLVDEISQLHSIYIFDNHQKENEQIIKECMIVKGIYTQIKHMCDAIKREAHRLVIDLTPVIIMSSTSSLNLDELDQSFMYTQLVKEILIDIEYDMKKARDEFAQFCLNCCPAEDFQSKAIKQFQRHYEDHSSIWWYTKEWFVYSSLNKALRIQDTEAIIKMGFLVQDLHREIKKQYSEVHETSKKIIYRGQGLSNADFEKLRKSVGGLFSFNNFLSTSTDRDVSFVFAESNRQNHGMTGILFKMEIDPSNTSTPFALIDNIGNFNSEEEILFSMHTVFRIGDMKQIDNRFWEVNLTLTGDSDPQLKALTNYIRHEIGSENAWYRMAMLMLRMGKYEKALEIFNILPEMISKDDPDILEMSQTFMDHSIGQAQNRTGVSARQSSVHN